MKIKIYKANSLPVLVIFTLLLTGCSDVLDKRDLNAISGTDVWNDEQLTLGYLNGIYENGLPDWPSGASGNSDDGIGEEALMYGELNSDSEQSYSEKYNLIYEINVLLDRIETGSLDENIKRDIKAQALFFRALHYFNLVTTYGGVPLVLNSNKIGDNLEIPRNNTSECIAQILEDLNTAISVLPDEYDADNYGRITKGAAMAYKGRVLLFYASEQFDPLQSQSERWQDAYDANKAALDALETQGKGLHPSFSDLWFDESIDNPEVIILRKYTTNKTTNRDVGVRPFVVGTAGENWDRPTLDLVESFPMKDGKSITDPNTEYTYDEMVFWKNRDPRFNATIAYNGSFWELNDPEPQRTSPLLWSFQNSQIEAQTNARVSKSSFYCRKAVDPSLEGGASLYQSTTDWIEIRFAEVLLNYAEAANEIGNTDEAYEALRSIRSRAGIDAGSGNYGLAQGMGKDDMRDAVMLERRLELAFEGKRSSDLRRRRMYAMLNGIHRKGFVITKTPDFDALNPSDEILDDRMALENQIVEGSIDLNNPETYAKYFSTVVTSVERDGNTTDAGAAINYQDSYYFFDLPQSALDKNRSLEQTLGWPGGSFDPLE